MARARLLVLDLAASIAVLLGGVWAYELSNWVSLSAQGYYASVNFSGVLPTGVVAVSTLAPSPLTKLAQVALAASLFVPAAVGLARARLVVARAFAIATVGVIMASFYWEMLSSLTSVPLPVHEAVFFALTGAMAIPLLRLAGGRVPRPAVPNVGRELSPKQSAV